MILTTEKVNSGYWKIIINNPPINLFGPEMSVELMALIDEMEADDDLKVVVFESSNPDFFIAHLDVIQANDFPKGEGKTGLSKSWPDIAKRLEQAPFASIAKVRGRARGLGSEFIQAMDMRFGSKEKALFAQVEIGIGAFPGGGGMERLPLLTGRARALEIILGGEDYDAETAAFYGWINRAISEEDLDLFVDNLAKRIASFDKKVIATIKSIINERVTLPKNEHFTETQIRFFEALTQPEAAARIKPLFEKGMQQHSDLELNFGKYI